MSIDDEGPPTPREQNLVEVMSFEERILAKLDAIVAGQDYLRGEVLTIRDELRELKIATQSLDAEMRGVDLELGSLRQLRSVGNGNGHHGDNGR